MFPGGTGERFARGIGEEATVVGANEQVAHGRPSAITDRTVAGFLSCLFCGLGPGDRVVSDLGDLARTAGGWRCVRCGGREAWFLPTSAGVPAVVWSAPASPLAAAPPVRRGAPEEQRQTVQTAGVVRC